MNCTNQFQKNRSLIIIAIIVLVVSIGLMSYGETGNRLSDIEIRDFCNRYGFNLAYNPMSNELRCESDNVTVKFIIGSHIASINNTTIIMSEQSVVESIDGVIVPEDLHRRVIRTLIAQNNSGTESTQATVTTTLQANVNLQAQSNSSDLYVDYIVIDPGHGGKDPGNYHEDIGIKEKDVILPVSMMVVQKLREKLPSVQIIPTRTTDVYLTLDERVEIAYSSVNPGEKGIFISIHANATLTPRAYGIETFYYYPNPDDEASNLANFRQNLFYESHNNFFNNYSEASDIIINMMSYNIGQRSRQLASTVHSSLWEVVKNDTIDRGIKESNFYVLGYINMPSILVEIGFLSNSDEAKRLVRTDYQDGIANGIASGIANYATTQY